MDKYDENDIGHHFQVRFFNFLNDFIVSETFLNLINIRPPRQRSQLSEVVVVVVVVVDGKSLR